MVKGYEEQIGTHNQNPLKHLIRECGGKVRKTREEISKKMNKNNIKFYRSYCMKRNGELQSRAIKEVVKIIDAK